MADRPLPMFIVRAQPLVRWRYAIIVIVGVLYSVAHLHGPERDWIFFLHGNELLFGQHRLTTLDQPGGLHLYANYPVLQIGPLALLAVTPFRLFGDAGNEVLAGVLTAAGIGLVVYLERFAKRVRGASQRDVAFIEFNTLIGGTAVMAAWFAVATQWVHVDDVLVLAFACLAMSAAARQSAWLLGLAIGLGVASKPWGMIMLPLILTLPRRSWWKALGLAGVIGSLAWLPFIIADPGTLDALKPTVRMGDDSMLRLVGIREPPDWIRPPQFAGSLLVGVLAVWRGRWVAVLFVGMAFRLLLDPGTFTYYSSGFVLAAFAWDLVRSREPLPVWTMITFWMLAMLGIDQLPSTGRAIVRLVITVGVISFVCTPRPSVATRGGKRREPGT